MAPKYPEARSSLLDADAVAKGLALGVTARQIVEGYRVGEHRSPFQGFALEFAQHREYTVGDDTRHIDWKVLGRTDRYYIKQYEQDTNFVAHIVVDGSESMAYGSGKTTKLQYAKVLAACLAHVILQQRDAVELAVFDTAVRERVARTDNPGKIHELMRRLAAFEGHEGTRIGKVLQTVAASGRRRGIVILISDFFDDEEELRRGIERLQFQGSEVIVFHVLDPSEMDFAFEGTVKFVGLEGAPTLQLTPSAIRKSYLKAFQEFRKRVTGICDRSRSHYVLANTKEPVGAMLGAYLAFRQNYRTR